MGRSALLVIDPQKIYTSDDGALRVNGARKIIARINDLVRRSEKDGDLTIFIRHIHKADGSDLGRMFDFSGEPEEPNFLEGSEDVEYSEDLYFPKRFVEIKKTRYSAFVGTPLARTLDDARVDTVIICGFMTNYCCESTARDAHDRDYFVDFVLDATGTPDPSEDVSQKDVKHIVSATLAGGIARVV